MSVAFGELTRSAVCNGLRRMTDRELAETGRLLRALSDPAQQYGHPNPAFALKLQLAIEEWQARRSRRKAGRVMCLCHVPGSALITPHAQTLAASRGAR